MTLTQDLLVEIGTEELPPQQLNSLVVALSTQLQVGLEKANLAYGAIKTFATPRRLAVFIQQVATAQATHVVEKRGPALTAAYDAQGHPTLACLGFAHSCNTTVDQLSELKNDKGTWLFYKHEQPGATTIELLPTLLQQAINQLPLNKPMRWGNHPTAFIRPVHWVVFLFGKDVVTTTILGQKTGRQTYGHRFHHPEPLTINQPSAYEHLLREKGFVIADFALRKNTIRQQVQTVTQNQGTAVIDEDLLKEVTNLVEWPVTLLGEFSADFLQTPAEVLITAMKSHQKYFPVIDQQNNLLPYFVLVSNINSKNPTRVIKGNQRVIRARLEDAQFFYQQDLKIRCDERLNALKKIIFQKKLGSLFEKSQRISALAGYLASENQSQVAQAQRAGLLAKTDLVSHVVGEFGELQGIMGSYYALNEKESPEVALAIRQHYQPAFAGDNLPTTPIACFVAIADKIDTIMGLFIAEQIPSGEKDPFGLRRAALGILRILIEKELPCDLWALLTHSAQLYTKTLQFDQAKLIKETFDFIMERLRTWYIAQGISTELFNAVSAHITTQPFDFDQRIQAVKHFQDLPEAQALTMANKRVTRILKGQSGEWKNFPVTPSLFEHKSEQQLFECMQQKNTAITPLYQAGHYTEVLTLLASLRQPIDLFFDEVMVMVEDEKQRNNRLSLLYGLQQLFLQVADISLL